MVLSVEVYKIFFENKNRRYLMYLTYIFETRMIDKIRVYLFLYK